MTRACRDWLPAGALTSVRIEAALADIVAAWSRHWFADGRQACPSAVANSARTRTSAGDVMEVEGKGVRASSSGRGKRALLEAALGEDLGGKSLTPSDHQVLDAFASRMLQDLVGRIEPAEEPACGEVVEISLGFAGQALCVLRCAAAILIPMIKSDLGGQGGRTPRLTGRRNALGPLPLQLVARLGEAQLAVEDLEGLAIGDVLILDRQLGGPVDLCLSADGALLARGQPGNALGRNTVTLS